jgi:hypothetical protein
MERADDTALEDTPEAFNGLGVYSADNVLPLGMVNSDVRIGLIQALVANPLIGAEQADLLRNGLVDESLQCRRSDVGAAPGGACVQFRLGYEGAAWNPTFSAYIEQI